MTLKEDRERLAEMTKLAYERQQGFRDATQADSEAPSFTCEDPRMQDQERRARIAADEFKTAEGKLYKKGKRYYSNEEHGSRLSALARKLHEDVGRVLSEVEEEIQVNERTARGLGYQDPTQGLASADRERLVASAPLVDEDCRNLSWSELADRLASIEASEDRVAKITHTRATSKRLREEDERLRTLARSSRGDGLPDAEKSSRRKVGELTQTIEDSLKDPEVRKKRGKAESLARDGKRLVVKLRAIRAEADGTDQAAKDAAEARAISSF